MNLTITGARTHNLRNITVTLPLNQITVVTGLSGSGKSSLVYDTLYAQSQRQYIEGLSPTLRQSFRRLPQPEVDSITPLLPTIAVDQNNFNVNPRSTVATSTEIHDYMRVLYARLGTVFCPGCGTPLQCQTQETIVDRIMSLGQDTKLMLLAPVVRNERGSHTGVIQNLIQRGLVRVRIDGQVVELESLATNPPDKTALHTIEAVIDRCVVRESSRPRITESVAASVDYSDGAVIVSVITGSGDQQCTKDYLYSTRYACLNCGNNLMEVQPRSFSFHSPYGACPVCEGLGVIETEGTQRECPDCHGSRLGPVARSVKILDTTICDWAAMNVDQALAFALQVEKSFCARPESQPVAEPLMKQIIQRLTYLQQSLVGYLSLNRGLNTLSGGELQRVKLSRALSVAMTGVCYILDEPSIGLHRDDCRKLLQTIASLKKQGNTIVIVEHDEQFIRSADHVIDIGPGAGEYGGQVIAEGTVGQIIANPNSRTGRWLSELDQETADSQNTVNQTQASQNQASQNQASQNQHRQPKNFLRLTNARKNNLQNVDLELPLEVLTCVTGRSGSGKSTLMMQTLLPVLQHKLSTRRSSVDTCSQVYDEIIGWEQLQRVLRVDQTPIGRSPRSNPATFTGVWDSIRSIFAQTVQSKRLGFDASRFSFNAGSGCCPVCQGSGVEKIELSLLPDAYVPCTACQGRRYNRQTLSVKFKDRSIADVLEMSIADAAELFCNIPSISQVLQTLTDVGLGYLRLGQGANTLSGGESQRLKLAAELSKAASALSFASGKTLFLLDEPTTGLHADDIKLLLNVLNRLTDQGNTVVVIEHNCQVEQAADWHIELGPEGGTNGGRITRQGPA